MILSILAPPSIQHYCVSSCIDAIPHAFICVIVTHAPIASPMYDILRVLLPSLYTCLTCSLTLYFVSTWAYKTKIPSQATSNQVERVTYMNTKWSRPPLFIETNDILHKNRNRSFSTTALSHQVIDMKGTPSNKVTLHFSKTNLQQLTDIVSSSIR